MGDLSSTFSVIAQDASLLAEAITQLDETVLTALESAAASVGRAWSKSNLGYQANVYFQGFQQTPPGAFFSREWGFSGTFNGSVGAWVPFDFEDVVAYVKEQAGDPDLAPSQAASEGVKQKVDALIHRARSAAARIRPPHDAYLAQLLTNLEGIRLVEVNKIVKELMTVTRGQFVLRDQRVSEISFVPAGHQWVEAEVIHVRWPFIVAKSLAEVCDQIGRHLDATDPGMEAKVIQVGSKVFIGHGGKSREYYALGVWLTDEGLEWDVFDRTPTAGLSTKERLSTMLDDAQMAFLLMTGEDETAEGKMRARENVVHEVGLFQGRIGFSKAIVLLEECCETFSNIDGLGQIRFPKGRIEGAFEQIRQVLKRENVLE